nr:MAG TPA: hypothetical protein [Caudoviricetes sp.]
MGRKPARGFFICRRRRNFYGPTRCEVCMGGRCRGAFSLV